MTPLLPLAQEAPPPAPALGPDFGGLVNDLLSRLGGVIQQAFSDWMANHGPEVLTSGFGTLLQIVHGLTGSTMGPSSSANVFTQLPPAWSYQLEAVVAMRERLTPVGAAVLALAAVSTVVWMGYGTIVGRPFGNLLNGLAWYVVAGVGLLVAPRTMQAWIDFTNAASRVLMNPTTGLPGLSAVQGNEHASAVGALGLVYVVFAAMFLVHRLILIVLADVLLITAPLAIAAVALPFSLARRFSWWWASTFVGITFVSVLQAACLGLGAALVASPTVRDSYDGVGQGAMAVALGIGVLIAAMRLPRMLLGGLARSQAGPELLHTARRVVETRAAGKLPGRATVTELPAVRPATPLLPARSGYVRSLVAEG